MKATRAHPKKPPTQTKAQFAQTISELFVQIVPSFPFKIQKRPFVHNSVCSQFLEGLFAILAECSQFCLSSFNRNSRGNPSLCWLEGGVIGAKSVNKHFVNKLVFPKNKQTLTEFAQTVSANCFYLGGWFLGWAAFP